MKNPTWGLVLFFALIFFVLGFRSHRECKEFVSSSTEVSVEAEMARVNTACVNHPMGEACQYLDASKAAHK